MKEKFNSLKGKLNLKILALLPMIFCLTGCGGKTQYLHTKISLTNWDIIGVINEASEQIGFSIAKTINSTFAITMKFLYSLPDEMKKTSISSLSEYTEFYRIVTIVQILAIVLIVLNYAISVAKHNMLQQGSSVSAITRSTYDIVFPPPHSLAGTASSFF